MFSWVDYFHSENSEKSGVKILKKSEFNQNQSLKDKKCDYKRRNNFKTNYVAKMKENSVSNMKQCSKILDLSPEEKEKIASLIRELGLLQSAKEKVSSELNQERKKFQHELSTMEQMYKSTLEDKERLAEELRQRNETYKSIEVKEVNNSRKELKYLEQSEQFVIVPKIALENIEDFYNSSVSAKQCFPGPPKSSLSHQMTCNMLRSHSSQSVENNHDLDRPSLMKEQNDLLTERKYLNIVLKQQKCLKKLTSKIAKLEESSKQPKISSESVVDISENSSTMTDPVDLVTPRILNQGSSDEESLSQSISTSSLSHCQVVNPSKSSTPLPYVNYQQSPESTILNKDDLLLITALNLGQIEQHLSKGPQPRLASPGSCKDSQSLLQVISTIEEDTVLDNYTVSKKLSISGTLSEDDILEDLFFTM